MDIVKLIQLINLCSGFLNLFLKYTVIILLNKRKKILDYNLIYIEFIKINKIKILMYQ